MIDADSCTIFSTEDGKFTCTLSSEFLALTATSYECWENFLQHLQPTLEALADIYSPPYFTRLGLRYRNVFDRETLNLSATRWGDLVRPAALGIVSEEDVKIDDVIEAQSAVAIELETGKLFCRYGLLKEGDGPNKFLLDNDFFLDQNIRGVKDAVGTLAKLNNQSGSVFRWFIKDALHNAMEPKNAEKK
ncbi:MAG: TIGR04255 family protein [Asticcacaulis sp.]|nr:TIGR04255 family protein [Asticcacaulis sp.]